MSLFWPSPPTPKFYGPTPPTPKFQSTLPTPPSPKFDPYHPRAHATHATHKPMLPTPSTLFSRLFWKWLWGKFFVTSESISSFELLKVSANNATNSSLFVSLQFLLLIFFFLLLLKLYELSLVFLYWNLVSSELYLTYTKNLCLCFCVHFLMIF